MGGGSLDEPINQPVGAPISGGERHGAKPVVNNTKLAPSGTTTSLEYEENPCNTKVVGHNTELVVHQTLFPVVLRCSPE